MRYEILKKKLGGLLISNGDRSYESKRNELIWSQGEIKDRININGRLLPEMVEGLIRNVQHLAFELTGLCNLNCIYCAYGKYYKFTDGDRTGSISWSTIKTTLDYVLSQKTSNSPLHISYYGGEPLLKIGLIKKTVNLCKTFTAKNITFTYGMTTNGILLKKNIEFLVENDFKINISLDGDEVANSFRIFKNESESYSKVIKDVLYIKDNYPVFFNKNINFLSVLHKKNSKMGVVEFFSEKFNKTPQINSVSQNNLAPSYTNEFFEQVCYNSDVAVLYECDEKDNSSKNIELDPFLYKIVNVISNFSTFKYDNYNNVLFQGNFDVEKSYIPTATCLPFSKKIFITTNGDILPCERVNYKHILGKVKNNAVELNNEKIADYYNKLYDIFKPICLECAYMQNCKACLLYLEMNDGAYCPDFASEEEANQDYQNVFSHCEKHPELLKKVIYEYSIDK